jgi:uncharacterized protein (DUF1684 family)
MGLPAVFLVVALLPASPVMAGKSAEDSAPAEYQSWRAQREQELRSPTGYLSLAGLYWLRDGSQTFGSAADNDFVLPAGRAPDHAGTFMLQAGQVTAMAGPGVDLVVDGAPITQVRMTSGSAGQKPTEVQLGELTFWAIERSGKIAIRLRDPRSEILKNYKGTKTYPYAADWLVPARFERFDTPRPTRVPTVLGLESDMTAAGVLAFEIDGQPHRLLATGISSTHVSLIFGDQTNGHGTYGGGRFLEVPLPSTGDATTIDFNRAYNPPCAYSPYTTCPLPPPGNKLPIRIEAGELIEGHEHP